MDETKQSFVFRHSFRALPSDMWTGKKNPKQPSDFLKFALQFERRENKGNSVQNCHTVDYSLHMFI